MSIKGHGFLKPVIKPEDYVLGGFRSAPFEVLQENGQWDAYLPAIELQSTPRYETNGCVAFGTTSCVEILMKRKDYN